MRPGVRALLLLLVLAPAVTLCLLGLRSIDAEEGAARREAREIATRIRADLADDLTSEILDVRGEVEEGGFPELAFRVRSTGRIEHPPTRSFPAAARSFAPGDLVAIRGLLERTDRALFVDRAPGAAIDLLVTAFGFFEDEDLVAILRDRAAVAFERAGEPEDAIRLSRETVEDHPAARDLAGYPLAPLAARRWAAVLRVAGREEEAGAVERDLASVLAENPWSLPEEQRALLRRDLPTGPDEILYSAIRGLVVPEVTRSSTGTGTWATLRGRAGGEAVLVTLRIDGTGTGEGVMIPEGRLRHLLAARAATLAEVTGATVSPGGGQAPEGTESIDGPLAGPFGSLRVLVAVRPRGAARWLPLLWAGLSVLLLAGLATGLLLGLRAVRREVRLARMRQEFLDNVSHELRTPLAAIRALAENLRDGAGMPERAPEYFDALERESRRVARLVEDVLDLSRLDRDAAGHRHESIDPVDLAREAVRELAADAEDFEVRVKVDDDLPPLRGDPDALRRALLNLLVNASRYSREDRTADLTLDTVDGRVRFAVRDRGPGIPSEDRRAVFDRFHRVASDTHEVKGAGLGLPLALAVVEAHGGTIRLESEVGRGSTFTMEVPAP